jgi:hypothetical protein
MYLKQILLSLDLGHRNIEYCYFLCREYINPHIIVRQNILSTSLFCCVIAEEVREAALDQLAARLSMSEEPKEQQSPEETGV